MAHVKVTELRQNLPAYLARVRRGERLQVTSRGKVIAQIAPSGAPQSEVQAARGRLRGSVLRWRDPLAPAMDAGDWEIER